MYIYNINILIIFFYKFLASCTHFLISINLKISSILNIQIHSLPINNRALQIIVAALFHCFMHTGHDIIVF